MSGAASSAARERLAAALARAPRFGRALRVAPSASPCLAAEPAYRAYCAARGLSPSEAARSDQSDSGNVVLPYSRWLAAQWARWTCESGIGQARHGLQERAAFESWLGAVGPRTPSR